MTFTDVGLCLDIYGVLVLGLAIGFSSDQHIEALSGTYFDSNSYFARELILQRIDTKLGILLLAAGFSAQIVGVHYREFEFNTDAAIGFVIMVGLALTGYFRDLRQEIGSRRCNRFYAEIRRKREEESQQADGV
ncbi:hypothetical protein GTQ45_11230 [Pyruvatibacter mobilis]|uniref:Uncharacterized protein n=1 Tax=Pyruvatibacter mobilis TaxID=1712261 RepID=A0A845QDJ8_9HYPH|nr:hypothetical protein [Pyruvatibacter mobilis]NBG96306.1 hypothetical protein [Pyruvatibacter mobilis]QJD75800.1 hypothetical protein HG718_10490 [Pyruvatibacter mobilis]GGD18684.1 hypothetical protein GCM10011587_23830 [Pyruvatibacter mobilis]